MIFQNDFLFTLLCFAIFEDERNLFAQGRLKIVQVDEAAIGVLAELVGRRDHFIYFCI